MEDNKSNETVTAVQDGKDVEMTKQQLDEKREGATRVVEGADNKPHILKRMNS